MTNSESNKWYAFVPNLITTLNLVCGVIAIYFAFSGDVRIAFYLLILGGLFDFLDGFAARLLHVSGDLGKQLDSLSDMITFGLLPGIMIFAVQRELILSSVNGFGEFSVLQWICLVSPIIIPVFSALRLAKFNIDTRQTDSFIGLPTPANAFFLASLSLTIIDGNQQLFELLGNPLLVSVIVLAFSILLISEIPLFALKFKTFQWQTNQIRYLFLLLSLIILIIAKTTGIMLIILLYLTISIGSKLLSKTGSQTH